MTHKFQLLSDIHLEMGTYFKIKPKAKYLLLAGDIGYPKSRIFQDFLKQCSCKFEKVFYTSGNHEYYNDKKDIILSIEEIDKAIVNICNQYHNVHYLQNDYYDLEDIRIVGSTLWSDIKYNGNDMNDYSRIYKSNKELITVSDIIQKYEDNRKYLETIIETSNKPLLIMTHHLPSFQMILPTFESSLYKSYFASNLDSLFKPPVVAWVCGHSHGFNKQIINSIPCIMNGIGYPSEQRRGASLDFVFEC